MTISKSLIHSNSSFSSMVNIICYIVLLFFIVTHLCVICVYNFISLKSSLSRRDYAVYRVDVINSSYESKFSISIDL
uniref:CPXV160 protein n=1 Tax=Heterorhabditis bacteriophora TaxID=37862 RepID=A0A1I7WHD7_HETBA